jgi:hypothetical protein
MSSFPLPDNSSIASSPEEPRPTEHSTLPSSPITTSRGKESVGPEPELQAILEKAMDRTGATGAAIALNTDDTVCCRASTGAPAPEVGTRLHAGISLTGLCLGTGKILICNDTNTDRRVDPQLCKEMGIRSLLVLPIKQNGEVLGVFEVLSINPNAFHQHDAAAMSKLVDQVLELLSKTAPIPDRCLDPPPSKDIEALGDLRELSAHGNLLQEHDNRLPTAEAAESPESKGHYVESQLPDPPVTTSQDPPGGARWSTIGLATALALAVVFAYGYHLKNPKVTTYVATIPIAGANHGPGTPRQHVLSEPDKKTNAQPKGPDSVLTATRQEVILAIQEAVQGTDVNHIFNRARAGDSVAQYELAVRYADGEGVPQDYRDAMAWFARAAASGNDKAQWKLGLAYIKGIGVPHDERKSGVWFKRAANQGNVRAQRALSDLYLSGRGVPRDYVRAYTWASIAAGLRGNDNDRLKNIGSRMTAVQIDDAKRRITIWWERQRRRAAILARPQKTAIPEVSDK